MDIRLIAGLLPAELLTSLQSAISVGRYAEVREIIERIKPVHQPFAQRLSEFADDFDSESILALLNSIASIKNTGSLSESAW